MKELVIGSYAPHLYGTDQHLDMLATAYHKGVTKRLAKLAEADGSRASAELFALYKTLSDSALPVTARCWQPEIGAVLACMSANNVEHAVIHGLFALHALGVGAHWGHRIAAPLRLSMAGHLFDVDGAFSVQASADQIAIVRHDSGLEKLVFERQEGNWRLQGERPTTLAWKYSAPVFLTQSGFESVYLQSYIEPSADDVPEMIIDWPVRQLEGDMAQFAARSAPQIAAAMQLLAQTAPYYLPWIKPLFRGMGPGPLVDNNQRQSGSFSWHPGVFSCGFPLSTPFLAEVIVHEMSHQHFMLADAVVPLVKAGRNQEIYFSSFKGKNRNIEKILLTFHAVANMVLFWHDFITNTGDADPANRDQMALMLKHGHGLVKVLRTSDDMTEAGVGMFESQCRLLRERGIVMGEA
ncbi:aKG-HExxH-type peptide beta-hydroxylase [Massilia sp. TSP1-1-2]|uniref:aKG-HExxH-type peptide beta-hydroxylase n=1 Tax=Massilia sp. TSP1-1-2 TaxID=2804649 RepID=UPI003CEA2144